MNKIRLLFLAGMIATAWTQSYALVDIGAYGGLGFGGKLELSDSNTNLTPGPEYGFIAHFNTTVIPIILSVGVGPCFQMSMRSYEISDKKHDFNKTTVGMDFYAQLELPIIIHPYVRMAPTIFEKDASTTQYFNGLVFGGGIAMTFFPFMQIYGEYLYDRPWIQKKNDVTGHAVHLGVRLNI